MSIRDELNTAMKDAMKAKDEVPLSTIRLILAAVKDRDIAARGEGKDVDDPAILSLLQSMIKQRRESAQTYQDAGRGELAEREEAEIAVIERFLPQPLTDEEAQALIKEVVAELGVSDIRDMGKVMAELKVRAAGRLDMGQAGGMVKGILGS